MTAPGVCCGEGSAERRAGIKAVIGVSEDCNGPTVDGGPWG